MKKCSKCGVEKPLSEFSKAKRGKFGVRSVCKSCQAKYYQNNREKITEQKAKYYQNNREKRVEYRQNNCEKISKKSVEYINKRYKNDPIFRLTMNLRTRLRRALKYSSKSASTFELIGMSGEELMDYLETMFRDGMTRENCGSVWHVDHIIPCSYFDLSDELQQRICFNWQNLQPLLVSENLSKHNALPDNYLELYNKIKESLV